MAASQLALSGSAEVHVFERRSGFGRKLLIAGSSGLNISHHLPIDEFAAHYEGCTKEEWKKLLTQFGPTEWIQFLNQELGLETFLGTSDRYFVREMKAANLLKAWTQFLEKHGVKFHSEHELIGFQSTHTNITLEFKTPNGVTTAPFDQAALFLGGGSWENEMPSWVELFRKKNIKVVEFAPSNVGYEVAWSSAFLKESEGQPLKKVLLSTSRGKKLGELVITKYGLEGTPVYFCGISGKATLDLKPDLTESEILKRLRDMKENFSPMRRVKHLLGLSPAAESLVFHHAGEAKEQLEKLISMIKRFPIELIKPRPLEEAISSRGGVALNEISEIYEFKKFPRIFCGGEMLDWDAPTGGFLIQACVSQGARIGKHLAS